MKTRLLLLLMAMFGGLCVHAEGTESPKKATLPESSRQIIDRMIESEIATKAFPGAQVVVGDDTGIIYSKSYGYTDYSKKEAITSEHIYDLASCTKVLASTIAVMRLIDRGEITLNTRLAERVDRYKDTPIGDLSLKRMLSHTTGLAPVIPVVRSLVHPADSNISLMSARATANHPYIYDKGLYTCRNVVYDTRYIASSAEDGFIEVNEGMYISSSYSMVMDSLILDSYTPSRLGRYRYSDLNFFLIQQMVECTAMKGLDEYIGELYDQMGISNLGFSPLKWKPREMVAPTECDMLFRQDTVRGYVHDEMAAVLGGVAGHAGLFGNAESVAALCTMLLANGEYNNTRVLQKETIAEFTRNAIAGNAYRGLGFDKMNPSSSPYSAESFGHTGFTGTYFWVDPHSKRYLVILTNRVHPSRSNKSYGGRERAELWRNAQLKR